MERLQITVGGKSGVGKSTVAKELAQIFGLEYESTGNFFCQEAKIRGLTPRRLEWRALWDSSVDTFVDTRAAQFFWERSRAVLDGRLAHRNMPMAIKILLTCDYATRIERLRSRESERSGEAISWRQMWWRTVRRELLMRLRFWRAGIEDYVDPKEFDIVIDAGVSKEGVIEAALAALALRGIVPSFRARANIKV